MGIGIQNTSRPPLPGKSDKVAPGRGPSEARLENQPGPEPVEIPTSTPAAAADQPVTVHLTAFGAGALNQALLAGAQPYAEANAAGQANPAPAGRGARGASAAATEEPKGGGAWTTQSLREAGLQGLALGSELLNTGFLGATREFAAALLTAGVAPLQTRGKGAPGAKQA